ncbi:hypothetical protein, partial [Bosea sp. BE125]|uniref:hypothetical protein n=1 Tax=Bosea sp. BE125 TaxID=2817909 RepID=UPI00286D50B5
PDLPRLQRQESRQTGRLKPQAPRLGQVQPHIPLPTNHPLTFHKRQKDRLRKALLRERFPRACWISGSSVTFPQGKGKWRSQ